MPGEQPFLEVKNLKIHFSTDDGVVKSVDDLSFGLDFGLLLGGAVLTEQVFSLPGLGKYAVDAITTNDLPKVLGVTLMAAFFVVAANLIVDLLYAVVDPRVRVG